MSDEEYRRQLRARVTKRVAFVNGARSAEGRRQLGRETVLKLTPAERMPAAVAEAPRYNGFQTSDEATLKKAIRAARKFLEAYSEVWRRWRKGDRDVLFPYGTWAMRVRHGADVAGPFDDADSAVGESPP
jgi:putative transposase